MIPSMKQILNSAMLIAGSVVLTVVLAYLTVRPPPMPPTEVEVETAARRPITVARQPGAQARPQPAVSSLREVSVWDTNAVAAPPPSFSTAGRKLTEPRQPQPAASPTEAREILGKLSRFNVDTAELTREQSAALNALFKRLVELGDAAIPAIAEFLDQNEDIYFDGIAGGDYVNYGTLRLGLLDALQQIGGPAALDASLRTLQSTADPFEIALLSQALQQQAPGQYRQAIIDAVRGALQIVRTGQSAGRDVSPLFEVLQAHGDASVVPDLVQAVNNWNYYATLALAGLPGGVGIQALAERARDPTVLAMGNGDIALRPLAQVALQYPTARTTLVEMARSNQIPASAWPSVAASLGGSYIQYGYQFFGSTAGTVSWSNTQISQRIAVIDQLLSVTGNSTGRQALQNARLFLQSRLSP
jgi:hypothetical protein